MWWFPAMGVPLLIIHLKPFFNWISHWWNHPFLGDSPSKSWNPPRHLQEKKRVREKFHGPALVWSRASANSGVEPWWLPGGSRGGGQWSEFQEFTSIIANMAHANTQCHYAEMLQLQLRFELYTFFESYQSWSLLIWRQATRCVYRFYFRNNLCMNCQSSHA